MVLHLPHQSTPFELRDLPKSGTTRMLNRGLYDFVFNFSFPLNWFSNFLYFTMQYPSNDIAGCHDIFIAHIMVVIILKCAAKRNQSVTRPCYAGITFIGFVTFKF
jgi:hypothetical protein